MRKYSIMIMFLFGMILAAGCAKKPKVWGPPVPATPEQIALMADGTKMISPQSGKPIVKSAQTPALVYKGRLYFFCCKRTVAEFEKDPDKYVLDVLSPNGLDISHTLED